MPLLVSCPKCRFDGHLPDDDPGGVVACPTCGTAFAPRAALAPVTLSSALADGLSVWVGSDPLPAVTPPPSRGLRPELLPGANPLPPPGTPPVEITAANAGAHLDWVRGEVRRFNGYVARQLDLLKKRREEVAALESRAAEAFVTRDLGLTRAHADLAARAAALDRRDADLAAERAALATRADAVAREERALERQTAEVDELEQTLRGELEEREADIERQRRAVEEARRDLRSRGLVLVPNDPTDETAAWHGCG